MDIAIVISILTFLVGLFIAYRQNKIANRTLDIGFDTKSITEKIETDRSVRERAAKLFPRDEKKPASDRYRIVYPVKYIKKPLPLINQGDFYAIHTLILAMGLEHINLFEVQEDGSDVSSFEDAGNTIFICSPQANPALNKIIPYATLRRKANKEDDGINTDYLVTSDEEIKEWLKNDAQLPCWFLNEITEEYDPVLEKLTPKVEKKIQVYDRDDDDTILEDPMGSHAEKCYRESAASDEKLQFGRVQDYGIFARITRDDKVYVIIAGLHQYGTWIVSDFLNRLVRRKYKDSDEPNNEGFFRVFESSNDFISIISGEFVSSTLSVDVSEVYSRKLWVKLSGRGWVKNDRLGISGNT